ncbi:MAG: propionyl-coenzyme A carboxylase alpha polypeptide [Rhizobiaceae bacterium]|nr:propionyl-coenzyme A carboxylase alpha polypeptide [Rhizobiaceae bacterium]
MLAIVRPPSARPGISPSRGEICKTLSPRLDDAAQQGANSTGGGKLRPCRPSISPLEGGMVGRSEGGVAASGRGGLR